MQHAISAVFLSPSNSRPARIKLTSLRHAKDSYTFAWDYDGDLLDQTVRTLQDAGYTIVACGDAKRGFTIMVEQFRSLAGAFHNKDKN